MVALPFGGVILTVNWHLPFARPWSTVSDCIAHVCLLRTETVITDFFGTEIPWFFKIEAIVFVFLLLTVMKIVIDCRTPRPVCGDHATRVCFPAKLEGNVIVLRTVPSALATAEPIWRGLDARMNHTSSPPTKPPMLTVIGDFGDSGVFELNIFAV